MFSHNTQFIENLGCSRNVGHNHPVFVRWLCLNYETSYFLGAYGALIVAVSVRNMIMAALVECASLIATDVAFENG